MLPQYGIKLAVHIITADFGDLVAKVCECLLRSGTLTRSTIARLTELPDDKVTNCLRVLIQHNCVQAFCLVEEGGYGEPEKTSIKYMALFNNMICRLRFLKFLSVVTKELDENCASVLEGLLQHGRLTLSQVLDRGIDYSNEGGIVRERFMKLVKARFIERCPVAEPKVSEESAQKKRGAMSNKITEGAALEDRVIAASTLMQAKRFFVNTDAGMDCDAEVSDCNKDPTWRVNFDEFKHLFRKKACAKCATKRLDYEAGIVLSAFLDATKAAGNTVSLSIDAIFEEVIKSEVGRTMTLEHVRAFLVQLGFGLVNPDGSYTLDLAEIIKHAQREEVESIVLKRYGKEAYRLFRLLAEKHNPVETSVICGRILVGHEDTKKLLYKMWMENYLRMEFVKRPRQPDLFVWSVNRNLNDLVLEELFHSALNLRIRAAHEKDSEREVRFLNTALANLDDVIMLFHDF